MYKSICFQVYVFKYMFSSIWSMFLSIYFKRRVSEYLLKARSVSFFLKKFRPHWVLLVIKLAGYGVGFIYLPGP